MSTGSCVSDRPPERRVHKQVRQRSPFVAARHFVDVGSPYVAPDAEPVIVQQVDGSVSATTSTGAVLTVTFGPVDGTHYRVTGFNIDRDTLLALAATASPSLMGSAGSSIPASARPGSPRQPSAPTSNPGSCRTLPTRCSSLRPAVV